MCLLFLNTQARYDILCSCLVELVDAQLAGVFVADPTGAPEPVPLRVPTGGPLPYDHAAAAAVCAGSTTTALRPLTNLPVTVSQLHQQSSAQVSMEVDTRIVNNHSSTSSSFLNSGSSFAVTAAATATTVPSVARTPTEAWWVASLQLYRAAMAAEGLSGRALRKLPLLVSTTLT